MPKRLRTYYCDTFPLPLPANHRFPIDKYRRLREHLQRAAFCDQLEFCEAPAATDAQLRLVHDGDYVQKIVSGSLTDLEARRIGFPWSPELVERSRRSTGATVAAANAALVDGAAVHLSGGTHHAFAERGQGFCVFNDVAVAIRVLQASGQIDRALVIDLDVHQGNGTAAIFRDDATVFTFSMHGDRNFPFAKCSSDLDIGLPDGVGDETYLRHLDQALDQHLPWDETDVVFYLAGADPYYLDRYGKLELTKSGLAQRDQRVLAACTTRGTPVTTVMAGGYCPSIEDIVEINAGTVATILRNWRV